MFHHYITKFTDGTGNRKATSWIQINFLGRVFCIFKKEIAI